jgi:hypothetical protein
MWIGCISRPKLPNAFTSEATFCIARRPWEPSSTCKEDGGLASRECRGGDKEDEFISRKCSSHEEFDRFQWLDLPLVYLARV